MKRFRFASLALASGFAAAAAVHAARPQYGGTLRVETQATLRAIDPAGDAADREGATLARRVRPLVFETLVQVDPRGGLRPLLATAWESDARGARWRFRLRSGVALHDGTPLEAWQVAASLRMTADGWTTSIDGEVIVVQPSAPRADLAWELSDARHAIVVRRSASELTGSGPFRVERLEPARLVLRAHDRYWGGRPFVDAVAIDMNRMPSAQLASIESGRAEIVDLQPADTRRVVQRGLQVAASRPLDLFVLAFEPHRAAAAHDAVRRALAGAVDRAAIASVLLQGRADAAEALLPSWLSGYSPSLVAPEFPRATRASTAAFPQEQRTLTLRVDPSDGVAKAIGDRIAVDAREAGFTVAVQVPAGLAPRPDVRLVRIALDPSSPDRTLARFAREAGARSVALATAETAPGAAAAIDGVARFERALLKDAVIVPVVHVPHLYAVSESVETWDGAVVTPTGGWNFANVWIRSKPQRE
jgi:peptide/nickel transport system substrate-binding protein